METLIYLIAGALLGGVIGYFLFRLMLLRNYVAKLQADELQRQLSALQLLNASQLSKAEVEQRYVSRELYEAINANLIVATESTQKEKDVNEKHLATILRITAESEQKLSRGEVEQNYVPKDTFQVVSRKL